jgi:hypothetical protein
LETAEISNLAGNFDVGTNLECQVFLIKFVSDDKIVPATYSENSKGLNNKVKRL